MKTTIKTNIDFGKLSRNLDKVLGKISADIVDKEISNAKEAIDNKIPPPLKDTTIKRRKYLGISGTKPLYATGSLYNSLKTIKKSDSAAVSMNNYGYWHQFGGKKVDRPPKRPFLFKKSENLSKDKGVVESIEKNIKAYLINRRIKIK